MGREDVKRILTDIVVPGWLAEHGRTVELHITEDALEHLADIGYSRELGARELHRVFEENVLTKVAELLASSEKATFTAALANGGIQVRREDT